jgi:hypothetical protein
LSINNFTVALRNFHQINYSDARVGSSLTWENVSVSKYLLTQIHFKAFVLGCNNKCLISVAQTT